MGVDINNECAKTSEINKSINKEFKVIHLNHECDCIPSRYATHILPPTIPPPRTPIHQPKQPNVSDAIKNDNPRCSSSPANNDIHFPAVANSSR
ncbi:hypothetical protein CDAR_112501 [Caerostris darwini]|uniref:Uncharacterized protein n=1 Tax=Caerostris darwini TaxID=1538125 RepID=A0AAV4Q153_9ARAC|nr:hypothetical protein CDAR_112501 [Caerostris darwini]